MIDPKMAAALVSALQTVSATLTEIVWPGDEVPPDEADIRWPEPKSEVAEAIGGLRAIRHLLMKLEGGDPDAA